MKQSIIILTIILLSFSFAKADSTFSHIININTTGDSSIKIAINTTTEVNNYNYEYIDASSSGSDGIQDITSALKRANEFNEPNWIQNDFLIQMYNFIQIYFFIPIKNKIGEIESKNLEQDKKLEMYRQKIDALEKKCN